MDKRDIASQAEKYKREMMKLYGRSTVQKNDNAAVPAVNVRPEADEPPEAHPESEREIKTESETECEPEPESKPEPEDTDMARRYPDPDLSELETDFGESPEGDGDETPEYVSEESIGTEKGYIQVNVRTGDDSEPIQGADVQVTAVVDGNLMILASGATDESGAAPLLEVPVPGVSYSQTPDPTVSPYSLFDVSVTASGFFNARSVDVPVFEGGNLSAELQHDTYAPFHELRGRNGYKLQSGTEFIGGDFYAYRNALYSRNDYSSSGNTRFECGKCYG
ncbi:MAG: hypothetical protein LUD57_03680 [Ruminococcus sp.]|nr:hypothetical protein [Ruminococcus sp.]